MRWAPDGSTLASASDDRTLRLWELPDLAPVAGTPARAGRALADALPALEQPAAAIRNGPAPAEAAEATGKPVELSAAHVSYGHGARLWDVQFSGGLVVSASEDCTCRRVALVTRERWPLA